MWKHNNHMSAMGLLEVADFRNQQKLITGGGYNKGAINVAMDYTLVSSLGSYQQVVTRYLFYYPKGPGHKMKKAPKNMWGGGWMGGGANMPQCPWTPNDCIASKMITTDFDFVDDDEDE